jgi:ABC-type branched-subunit amino acid transport system ATPase component/ABC-type branched-subunit amino acid transport system permease subunit
MSVAALGKRLRIGHVLLVLAVLYVCFGASDSTVQIAGLIAIYAISALGLDWLMGRVGQVSVGNPAFMALGAYTTALVAPRSYAPFPVPLIAAGVVGGVVGLIIGLPALRFRGLYLALATLALFFIVGTLLEQYDTYTGNYDGRAVPPLKIGGYTFQPGVTYTLFLLAVLGLVALLLGGMYRRGPGREWRAIAESETAAGAIGVASVRMKLKAFVGSSALIAISGSLYAYYTQRASADTFASLDLAVLIIAMIYVGGAGSRAGAVTGAVLLIALPDWLTTLSGNFSSSGWLSSNISTINTGIYGLIVLLVLVFFPSGIVPLVLRLENAVRRRIVGGPKSRTTPADDSVSTTDRPASPVQIADIGEPTTDAVPPEVLSIKDLTVSYLAGTAVSSVSLRVGAGEVVALLGRNGAGKTTTLRSVPGFGVLDNVRVQGSIMLHGRELSGFGQLRRVRAGVALVPEREKVLPSLTVAEQLRLVSDRRNEEVLERFPALKKLLSSPAGALSGGERQMLAIAMALARRPRLLLVDELSLGLAPRIVTELMDQLAEIARSDSIAILIADQNVHSVLSIAERAYLLEDGRIAWSGAAAELAEDDAVREVYFGMAVDGA